MALTPIPSILDTAKFEHLALSALYQIASGSGGGTSSNVTIVGSLPAGTNAIGTVNPDSSGGTGTLSASANTYTITTTNYSTLSFQAVKSGTINAGSITIYGSVDGTTFSVLTTYVSLTTGGASTTFAATNSITVGQINTVGLKAVQFSGGSTITGGGSLLFTVNQSARVSNVMLDNPLPAGTNVIGATYSTPNVASGTFGSAAVTTSGTITGLGATTRKYLQIQNIGTANPLYVTTDGTTATATNGFVLQPNGGSVTWEGSFVPNGAITGFSTTTTCAFLWA